MTVVFQNAVEMTASKNIILYVQHDFVSFASECYGLELTKLYLRNINSTCIT